jgi:hypothetical protein
MAGGGNDKFLVATVALKLDPTKGTARPSGHRKISDVFRNRPGPPASGLIMDVPNIGNFLAFSPSQSPSLYNLSIPANDSVGDPWHSKIPSTGVVQHWYAWGLSPSSSREVSLSTSGTPATNSYVIGDWQDADDAADPVIGSASTDDTGLNSATLFSHAPNIIPTGLKGSIFARASLGDGPGLGLAAGSPADARWILPTNSAQSDANQITNSDCVAYFPFDNTSPAGFARMGLQGSGVAAFNWTITSRGANDGYAGAIFIKAKSGDVAAFPRVKTFVDLTGAGRGTLQSDAFDVDASGRWIYLLAGFKGNDATALSPMTASWVGGTPANATAWEKVGEAPITDLSAVATIWRSKTSGALSGVQAQVAAAGLPSSGANAAVLVVDVFANAADALGHSSSSASTASVPKSTKLLDLTSGAFALGVAAGDGGPWTAAANNDETAQITSASGPGAGAVVNSTDNPGSATVGWTGSQTFFTVLGIVVRAATGLPDVELADQGASVSNATTSLSLPYPTAPAAASGEKLLAFVSTKGTNAPSTPTGWGLLGQASENAGTAAADNGTVKSSIYERAALGSESGNAGPWTKTTETGQVMAGVIAGLRQNLGTGWETTVFSTGVYNTSGANSISAASVGTIDSKPGDIIAVLFTDVSDVGSAYTADALAGSGLTFDLIGVILDVATTTGNDERCHVALFRCRTGTATVALTFSATGSGTATGQSHKGAASFARIRATPVSSGRTGDGSGALGGLGGSAAGAVEDHGAGSGALGGLGGSATGTVEVKGDGSGTLGGLGGSGAAGVEVKGDGSGALGGLSGSGDGAITSGPVGDGAGSLGGLGGSGTGTVAVAGDAAGALGGLGGAASGGVEVKADGVGAIGGLGGSADGIVGTPPVLGDGSGAIGGLGGSGAGTVEDHGAGAGAIGGLGGGATGTVEDHGAGAGSLGGLSGAAAGTVEDHGAGAGSLGGIGGAGQGGVAVTGGASGALGGLSGSADGIVGLGLPPPPRSVGVRLSYAATETFTSYA